MRVAFLALFVLLWSGTTSAQSLSDNDRALIDAARRNDVAAARVLIGRGANVNAKDDTQQSAYLISTSEGYVELLRLTLAHGADVHATDSYNGTGLIRAADRGHVEVIRELLKTPIRIDHVNRLGWTALLEAVILGDGGPQHTETVRLLVRAGANTEIVDPSGLTALQHARKKGFREIEAILTGKDTAATMARALLDATRRNDIEAARRLITAGADVNAQDENRDSAFLLAGAEGRLEILKLALQAGADLRSTNRYGGTALIPACHHGHIETVRELLKTAIDVNHVNRLGWTALLETVILGDGGPAYVEITRLLVAHKADLNLADKRGVTPLAHARQRGYRQIASILESAGAR
ncbi:MAG: ankyrin repeat domain-containing protein [Rhodospirillaceae bacterium]|nr:ankyrin repeat domain-containing protein [Rhodospirillaceae bacterium]